MAREVRNKCYSIGYVIFVKNKNIICILLKIRAVGTNGFINKVFEIRHLLIEIFYTRHEKIGVEK